MSTHSPGEAHQLQPVGHRVVPFKLYPNPDPKALIVFSVGFGGSKDSYAYLARHWNEHGYLVAVVEHLGSNLDVLKRLNAQGRHDRERKLWQLVRDPLELQARARDLKAVTDHLEQTWPGLALAVAGHSYGSATALAKAGVCPLSDIPGLDDPRFEACLSISPQPPGLVFAKDAYQKARVPVFVLTGTEDGGLPPGMNPTHRAQAFELLPRGYLGILEGATHMSFANQGLGIGRFLAPVKNLTTAFWDTVFTDIPLRSDQAVSLSHPVGLEWRCK